MPLTIFTNQIPTTTDANIVEGQAGVTLGTLWLSDQEGVVRGVRFYLGNRNYDGATVVGGIFDWELGTLLTQQNYVISTADPIGFVTIPLTNPPLIKKNRRYITAVYFPCDTSPDGKAHYAYTGSVFDESGISNPPLHALRSEHILNRRNGLFKYGSSIEYPNANFGDGCYFVDVSFDYIARMPIYDQATGGYKQKVIKYRQGGQWRY
ncbi:MAG TPA: DUF4082 domain-containing protein [Candidatus Saccharimonadales bacterium]|nr:DUF4082 domain-containing protein [Candidatus Saccharimonadales bacterium]